MRRISGSAKRLCNGITRRDLLQIGGISALGLGTGARAANAGQGLTDWPFMGSVVDYLDGRRTEGKSQSMPRNVGLPWRFCSKGSSSDQAGPYAAFLGNNYDPFWTGFEGKGTVSVPKLNADSQKEGVWDPHAGIEAMARFPTVRRLPAAAGIVCAAIRCASPFAPAVRCCATADGSRGRNRELQRSAAASILTDWVEPDSRSPRCWPRTTCTARALWILLVRPVLSCREKTRGSVARFVSVFWDPFGPHGASVWDTHSNHFPRLRNYLLPVFDQSYSALIADLDDRGLLDETLVLCTSEHGRTPKIDSMPTGGGRYHWSRAYSSVFAGGGMA